jgi:hypothetical protein
MSFFKRKKEKVLIPEVNAAGPAQPSLPGGSSSSSSSGRGGGKKEQPDPDGFEKLPGRRHQREQYNYQPPSRPQQAGGYGNYGNYGGQQQQPQLPRGQQMQQPPIEGGLGQGALSGAEGHSQQQGYGDYDNNARSNLFKGARAPAPSTGAAFDRYTADGRGGDFTNSGEAEKEGNEGEGVLSGNQETEEDDEV